MREVGKISGRGGKIARVTGWLGRLIRAAGDRLFQAEDARAKQYGWQITARRGGLARTYRDPRFDRFCSCPGCRGIGPAESRAIVAAERAGSRHASRPGRSGRG